MKSLTKGVVALSLALAVVWSLLACASLCTLESTLHDSQASTRDTIADANADDIQPIDDCCLCPDISSPAAATQQRETGEPILALTAIALPIRIDIAPYPISSHRIADLPDRSASTIHAPPLFVRLRTFRI